MSISGNALAQLAIAAVQVRPARPVRAPNKRTVVVQPDLKTVPEAR